MAGGGKNCRHVGQAVRLADFRRALKKHAQLACEICSAPSASRNHRADSGAARRPPMSPVVPEGGSSRALLHTWETHAQASDLCICVSCGFVGCFSGGHFSQHFQVHPKHFVGLQVASKTFWCAPCHMDIPENARTKVENARQEFRDALEEIAGKKCRQIRNQMRIPVPSNAVVASPASPLVRDGSGGTPTLDLDAHANTPPVPRGALTLAPTSPSQDGTDGESEDSGHGVAPLLSMPVRTKARDEKMRRQKLKTAMHQSGEGREAGETESAGEIAATTLPNTVLGFTNLGNTCYFNAPMQALLTATHYFPEHTHIEEMLEKHDTPITTTFTMLHETVKKRARRALAGTAPAEKGGKGGKSGRSRSGSSSVLTVAPLLKEMRKKFVQFQGHYQQDAHELFTSFLWAIDEEMDPPRTDSDDTDTDAETDAGTGQSVVSSTPSTTNSSDTTEVGAVHDAGALEDADDEGVEAEDGEQATSESEAEDEEDEPEEESKQIFVKTETGETISMQVPMSATVKEVQTLLAKRLNLKEEDMMLDASQAETRATLSSRPSAVLHARAQRKVYSKLNFTRSLFGGALTTAVTCHGCGKRTEIVEDAFHLSLSVPEGRGRGVLSTIDCLNAFVSETQLLVDHKNGYDCEKCSRVPKLRSAAGRFMRKKRHGADAVETQVVLRDASMQLFVSALPRVLVLHLKRLARARKITQHIAFEERLDMAPYVSETLRHGGGEAKHHSLCYELMAVVVHMGNKRSGHYVAYVSRSRRREALLAARARGHHSSEDVGSPPETPAATSKSSEAAARTWYYVSDTVVKRVSLEQVLQCEAYMLFYQRRPLLRPKGSPRMVAANEP